VLAGRRRTGSGSAAGGSAGGARTRSRSAAAASRGSRPASGRAPAGARTRSRSAAAASRGSRPASGRAAAAAALREARRGRRAQVAALADFVRIPSVSGDARHAAGRRRAAGWLAARLRALGAGGVRTFGPPGAPLVTGAWPAPPGAPTLLIYGHYDVVAPEPLAAWRTPPFAPVVRDGFLCGRGVSDDKGPIVCQLEALRAWVAARGRPPVGVRCLFEGEEESGSGALLALLRDPPPALRADAVLVCDTRMLGAGRPTLIEGLRGSLAAELIVSGPPRDLHSGAFGGAVRNPAHVLCALLASLHDADGRVAIPGFYARVRGGRAGAAPAGAGRAGAGAGRSGRGASAPGDRALLAQAGVVRGHGASAPSDRALLAQAGVARGHGERGFSAYERTALRPALDVNGLLAGHTGAGSKSIVPARASAKLSFRLVPGQRPAEVAHLLRRHLLARAPADVRVELRVGKHAPPYRAAADGFAQRAAARALRASFGRAPVVLRSGGSIPVVGALAHALRAPVVLMGFASPDDGMHGPNERFALDSLARGTDACARFLGELARSASTAAVP
jgi:acetylornithine deacetylase/succinyl-diaminopimelate desuccinylase-like protein